VADDVTSTTAGGTDATTGSNRTKGSAGSGSRPNSRPDWACQAGRIADEFRSRNVVVIDLTSITPIVDYIVVATGTSGRQMRAVADEISRVFKAEGDLRLGIEGYDHDSSWILIDFGDIVIHLQDTDARLLYDLEGLWPDAARVDWQGTRSEVDETPSGDPAPPADSEPDEDLVSGPDLA
jgi:ribosome-associated protein